MRAVTVYGEVMKSVVAWACGAAMALALSATTVRADEPGRHGGARAAHFDERYSHNHYYPRRRGWAREGAGRPFIVERGGGRCFCSGGGWYAPYGPRFVVVGAPI